MQLVMVGHKYTVACFNKLQVEKVCLFYFVSTFLLSVFHGNANAMFYSLCFKNTLCCVQQLMGKLQS